MKTLAIALGLVIAANTGMVLAATQEHDMSQHQMTMHPVVDPAKHEGVGVLKAVNAQAGKLQISHEPIVDLGWPAMTMWLPVRDPLPHDIKVGDAVRFELMQGENKQWAIVGIVRK